MKELADHFFRHESGRLVATLCRRFGTRHLERIEDAVQFALEAALRSWPTAGLPDAPGAWLQRVAHHRVLEELRADSRRSAIALRFDPPAEPATDPPLDGDVRDELLRMLFACCDEALPQESQLVLALKVLCGFDVKEIAERLFTTEANVYKRLTRARTQLREVDFTKDLTSSQLVARRPAVLSIVSVLFTEGYLSSHPDGAIRRELCDEAIRLGGELARHTAGDTPETAALMALMHLHAARMAGRTDATGGLLLLEEQDRTRWDAQQLAVGLEWLARSARGETFSRYHAEAGVAAEHCLAPSFAETRWDRVVACYELLDRVAPSPLHTLNRAVALAEWRGPEAGLELLSTLAPPSWLEGSHLWSAVLADLHRRAGHPELAAQHRAAALASTPNDELRKLLERRLRA